jgi:hypothetical protein
VSIGTEYIWKNPTPFLDKKQANFLNPVKGIYKNPITNIILGSG